MGADMSSEPANPDAIGWVCSICGDPATTGVLHVDLGKVNAAQAAEREWRQRHPEGSALDIVDILAMPERAQWQVSCEGCAHDCDGCYSIELRRCRTWTAAIGWTAHLYDKSWFGATNWMALLDRVAQEHAPHESVGVW